MKDDWWRTGKMLVKGITVAYDDGGEGDDVLVLVHGHPFNRTMWRPQMEWIEGFNRARARARPRSEGVDGLTGLEGLRGDVGIEPSMHSIFEHEDEHEHERQTPNARRQTPNAKRQTPNAKRPRQCLRPNRSS